MQRLFYFKIIYSTPYNSIPKTAEIKIKIMGETAFLKNFLCNIEDMATIAKITSAFQSKTKLSPTDFIDVITDSNRVIPVPIISPTTTGLTPPRKAFTPANFISPLTKEAITSIMINDGKTTPSVARTAPQKPPTLEPIKVAIFIATGPGVDSATAIKFITSS